MKNSAFDSTILDMIAKYTNGVLIHFSGELPKMLYTFI